MEEDKYYHTVEKFSWIYNLWKWADENHIDCEREYDSYGSDEFTFRGIPRDKDILKSMKNLNLAGYNLDYLPIEIGNLINLTSLTLDDNNLVELPYSIVYLENLEYLSISTNNLISLPEELSNLEKLHRIVIRGNNLKSISPVLSKFINYQD